MAKQHHADAARLMALIGNEPGMAVVETINTYYPMRYLRPAMEAGQLDLSKAAVRRAIGKMVPAVLKPSEARVLWDAGKD